MKKKIIILLILLSPFIVFAYPKGDVDGDNRVKSNDYILVRKHILKQTILTGDKYTRADVNGDGKVTSLDFVAIRKTILNGGGNTETPIPTTPPTVKPTSIPTSAPTSTPTPTPTATPTPVPTVTPTPGKVINQYDSRNKAVLNYFNDSSRNIVAVFTNNSCSADNRCDIPKLYSSSIKDSIKIYAYDATTGEKTYIKTVDSKSKLNYALIPGNTYYLKSTTTNDHEYVSVNPVLRMINVTDVRNVRDMGGWKADGGTIKYGLIYRGANPNTKKAENIFNELGINVIVDLRSASQFKDVSSFFSGLKKYNFAIGGYLNPDKLSPRDAVRQIMKSVVDGKTVYFHCAVGTDRTGTVAYILEGILGVSKSDRLDDYELSYFFRQERNLGKTRNGDDIKDLIKRIDKYPSTNYEQEKFINWLIDGSKDKDSDINLINKFRSKVITGRATKYAISGGKLVIAN